MKNKTLITILRWIAVLPAAIGAGIAMTLLGMLFTDIPAECNPTIGLFSSIAAVSAGAYTAPSAKKIVAIVLATIKCMLPLIGVTFAIITSSVGEYKWYEWLNIVAIIAGSIIAARIISQAES